MNVPNQDSVIKDKCPLDAECLLLKIVCQGEITSSQPNYAKTLTLELQKSSSKILQPHQILYPR